MNAWYVESNSLIMFESSYCINVLLKPILYECIEYKQYCMNILLETVFYETFE